ncbi:MAG: hypothetical protein ACREC5_01485, partial [Thermoplasmata archaeon]
MRSALFHRPAPPSRAGRWRSRAAAGGGALGIGALLLLVPALAQASVPTSAAFASYNSGQVSVVFPGTLPSVELFQDANASLGAALHLEHVLEFQPGTSDHPLVVETATPANAASFTATSNVSGSDSFHLGIDGALTVVRSAVPLWTTPLGLPGNATDSPVSGVASLVVSYSLTRPTGASQGLNLSWSISD